MIWRTRLPGALYRRAIARAGSDRQLADAVRAWLDTYVSGQTAAQQLAASGGLASAQALSPEARQARARAAALARWERQT